MNQWWHIISTIGISPGYRVTGCVMVAALWLLTPAKFLILIMQTTGANGIHTRSTWLFVPFQKQWWYWWYQLMNVTPFVPSGIIFTVPPFGGQKVSVSLVSSLHVDILQSYRPMFDSCGISNIPVDILSNGKHDTRITLLYKSSTGGFISNITPII